MMKAVGMKPISNVSHLRSPQSSSCASWQLLDQKRAETGPCDIAGMGPTVRLLGPNLHKESCNEGPPPRAKIWAIWELDSPPELPTSYICPHSWSGWQRRGWPGRSTSCPKTLRSSQSFALTPFPSSTYPHRSPSSPLLPSLMYSLASRHATTESKLWPPGGGEGGETKLA